MSDYVPLVTVEGRDGVGKSTLVANLATHFRSRVNCIRFPSRTGPFTKVIYRHLLDQAQLEPAAFALVCAADRAQETRQELLGAELCDAVICDRYLHSGIAYALASGVDAQFACMIESQQILPTAVIYLELDDETASQRLRAREAQQGAQPLGVEAVEHQKRVVQGFETAFLAYPSNVLRLDASASQEELTARAAEFIEALVSRNKTEFRYDIE